MQALLSTVARRSAFIPRSVTVSKSTVAFRALSRPLAVSLIQNPRWNSTTPVGRSRSEGRPSETIFVGGISFKSNEKDLAQVFQSRNLPKPKAVRLAKKQGSGRGKGYGHIEYASIADASTVLESVAAVGPFTLDGRTLNLDYSVAFDADFGSDRRLHLRNVHATENEVRALFKGHAEYIEKVVSPPRKDGTPKNWAHVFFKDARQAKQAYEAVKEIRLPNGELLDVRYQEGLADITE